MKKKTKQQENIPPEQERDEAMKALRDKFDQDCIEIERKYQIRKRQQENTHKSEFDKMLGAILKVPKPRKG